MKEISFKQKTEVISDKEMEQISKMNTYKRQEIFSSVMFWIIISLLVIASVFVIIGWLVYIFCEVCSKNTHFVEVLTTVTSTWIGVILAYASKHYIEK